MCETVREGMGPCQACAASPLKVSRTARGQVYRFQFCRRKGSGKPETRDTAKLKSVHLTPRGSRQARKGWQCVSTLRASRKTYAITICTPAHPDSSDFHRTCHTDFRCG